MDIITEAGFPVWFVLVVGTYALVQAIRYRVGAGSGAELVGAVAATLLLGALGTAYGAQLAFGGCYESQHWQHWHNWVGVKEGLNFDVACVFGIAASLVATVGRRGDAIASAG